MCSSRAFRPANGMEKYFCETRFGTIKSVPQSPTTRCECGGYCPSEKPYTAEELRRIRDIIVENQKQIKEHVTRKKQKEEDEWVFEKSANGWI